MRTLIPGFCGGKVYGSSLHPTSNASQGFLPQNSLHVASTPISYPLTTLPTHPTPHRILSEEILVCIFREILPHLNCAAGKFPVRTYRTVVCFLRVGSSIRCVRYSTAFTMTSPTPDFITDNEISTPSECHICWEEQEVELGILR